MDVTISTTTASVTVSDPSQIDAFASSPVSITATVTKPSIQVEVNYITNIIK